MISINCFSLNNFVVQYLILFTTIGLWLNFNSFSSSLVSLFGQILILSLISWKLTKKFRKFQNKELITSYKRAVVVTGCDTGFGNALAHKLNQHGFRVYATVLDPESAGAKDLIAGARFEGKTKVMRMDVTNDKEVKDVYQQIKTDLQQNNEELWAVVNNAGILALGPIDWGTIDDYKRVFEVNTFGAVRVTRTFLPLIRKSKGRIVNLVSMAGRLTPYNMTSYSMSKHAMISFSDGLRRENQKFGIKVSTIEPMSYRTSMATNENANREYDRQWNQSSDDIKQLYGEEYYKFQRNLMDKFKGTPFEVSDKIYEVIDKLLDAIRSPQPEISYQVAPILSAKVFIFLGNLMPTEVYDYLMMRSASDVLPAVLENEK